MKYATKDTCSTQIDFEVDGDVLTKAKFTKGCPGSLIGLSKLVEGMKIDDVISKLSGTRCAGNATSCPDQLAKALIAYKEGKR